MTIDELSKNLIKVKHTYLKKFGITESDDWFLLKIQEELGELVSASLKLSGRARIENENKADLEKNLQDEVADVLAMTLLFAKHKNIDVEKAFKEKWFKYLT